MKGAVIFSIVISLLFASSCITINNITPASTAPSNSNISSTSEVAGSIKNITFTPQSPAHLSLGQRVYITYDYFTNASTGVLILPIPNGPVMTGLGNSTSPIRPAGIGHVTDAFVTTGSQAQDPTIITQVCIQMLSINPETQKQDKMLVEECIPVSYHFTNPLDEPLTLPAGAYQSDRTFAPYARLNSISINSSSQSSTVSPGAALSGSANFDLNGPESATVMQGILIYSWTPSWPPPSDYYLTLFNGTPGIGWHNYTESFNITAPSTVGTCRPSAIMGHK